MVKKIDTKIKKKASETSKVKAAKKSNSKQRKTKKVVKIKKKHLEKTEFIFNFLSLVALISIGVYFGGRSLYYYSKQNIIIKEEAQTLNGYIINNDLNIVQGDADGLHHDTDGYFFKGNVENNYVWFGNRMFRVLRVYNDNSVKLVSEDLVSSFMYGEDTSYRSSNIRKWLTKIKNPVSGVYYDTLPNVDNFLDKTNYSEDVMKDGKVEPSKSYSSDYVTTLTIADYILASGKNSFLNNNKIFFLLGFDNDGNNLFVDEDGSIQSCDYTDGYGIRAVITLKENTIVSSGTGIKDDPYVVDLGEHKNHVDGYVKLADDIWKVFYDKDGILKLYLNNYLTIDGQEFIYNYSSSKNSYYDLNDKKSLAYFLNNNYLSKLSYYGIMLDIDFYTGEISDGVGFNYYNIYDNKVTCKVGLLNVFDYVSNNQFDDYFHVNYTGLGGMQYTTHANGLLTETNVSDAKHIVPVIAISSSSIKGGEGTLENPYVVE